MRNFLMVVTWFFVFLFFVVDDSTRLERRQN
jgi:hypothetical protein